MTTIAQQLPEIRTQGRLDWRVLAATLAAFVAVTYLLCVMWGILVPDFGAHRQLETLLPGFRWLTWSGFLIGLAESVVGGVYAGALFAGLFNLFSRVLQPRTEHAA